MERLALSPVIRRLYGFRGYKVARVELSDQGMVVSLGLRRTTADCPECGHRCGVIEETFTRMVRDLDVSDRRCFLQFPERKIRCRCGFRGREQLQFVEPYRKGTTRFEDVVFQLCEEMTLSAVAEHMQVSWHTVKDIDKKYLRRLVPRLEELHPRRLGVDEIAHQKGHQYLTVVRDLDRNAVIWVGVKRKKTTLDRFFTELGPEKCREITLFVTDMWDPYISSIKAHTKAEIVFDKFHVAQKINEALDAIRKQEFKNADPEERKRMKKKRFLILTRKKNLPAEKHPELDQLMQQNQTLYQAYLLKEQGLAVFDEKYPEFARQHLDTWIDNVQKSGLAPFQEVVKTIQHYRYGIDNYFIHRETNGQSEGFNNKINVLKRRAYGYRDLEYFKLKIIQTCGPTKKAQCPKTPSHISLSQKAKKKSNKNTSMEPLDPEIKQKTRA